MYLLREDRERPLLTLELSGHVTTSEAVQLMSVAAELLHSGSARAVRCDLSALEYGPDRPTSVASALAALVPGGVPVAVSGTAEQRRGAARIFRLAHAGPMLRTFASMAEAEDWLAATIGTRRQLPATARRHVEALTSASPAPGPAGASATARGTSAA